MFKISRHTVSWIHWIVKTLLLEGAVIVSHHTPLTLGAFQLLTSQAAARQRQNTR